MKTTRSLIFVLLVVVQLFTVSKTFSSHIAGVGIYYDWLSGNQYQVSVIVYRDCFGSSIPDSLTICMHSQSNNFSDSLRIPVIGNPINLPGSPFLPVVISTCSGGSGFGIQKYHFTEIINLPFNSSDWVVSCSSFHYNSGSTIPNPYGQSLYVETKIDNVNYPQNASVRNGNDPAFQYCVTQPVWENLLINDPDGDSLQFSFISTAFDSVVCPPQPYISIPPLVPVPSSIPYYIHPTVGWMNYQPSYIAVGMLSIKTKEFRNGNLINETTFSFLQSSVGGCIATGLGDPEMGKPILNAYYNSELIHINAQNLKGNNYTLRIFNSIGQPIFEESGSLVSSNFSKELSSPNSVKGIYFIRLETETEVLTKGFLK